MTDSADVPTRILKRLRSVCLALPEVNEEIAWVGVRWQVRKRTFAHVLCIDPDNLGSYSRSSAPSEPLTVVTFRAGRADSEALLQHGPPFFKPGWGRHVLGMMLDGPGRDGGVTWKGEVD